MCKRTNGDNIISVFKDSLLIDSADLAEKCADTGVSFIDNQIIQRIPIISLLLGTVKVGVDICRMVVCHNFSRFITRVRAGEATDIEIKEHLNKLDSPKKLNKELGMIAVYLQKNTADIKNDIFAAIYVSFIKKQILYDDLCELFEITDRLFVKDIDLMHEIATFNQISGKGQEHQLQRLQSLGLVQISHKVGDLITLSAEETLESIRVGYYFTELGQLFYEYLPITES